MALVEEKGRSRLEKERSNKLEKALVEEKGRSKRSNAALLKEQRDTALLFNGLQERNAAHLKGQREAKRLKKDLAHAESVIEGMERKANEYSKETANPKMIVIQAAISKNSKSRPAESNFGAKVVKVDTSDSKCCSNGVPGTRIGVIKGDTTSLDDLGLMVMKTDHSQGEAMADEIKNNLHFANPHGATRSCDLSSDYILSDKSLSLLKPHRHKLRNLPTSVNGLIVSNSTFKIKYNPTGRADIFHTD